MNNLVSLVLMSILLGSCSLISVDKKTRYSDASGFFDAALLDQIKADETSGVWMRQHFGDPLFVDQGFMNPMVPAQQVEIDTWRFVRHQQKSTSVFLLFRSRSRDEESEYLHAVLADDRVVKAWRDTIETVDTRRVMGTLGYAPVTPPPAPVAAAAAETAPQSVAPVEEGPAVPPAAPLNVKDVEAAPQAPVKALPPAAPAVKESASASLGSASSDHSPCRGWASICRPCQSLLSGPNMKA